MSSGRPPWRRGFDRAERLIGKPLEDLVGTQGFNDLMVRALWAEKGVQRLVERQTRAVLHALNLPARSDVTSLRRQLGALRADVREVAAKLEAQQRELPTAAHPARHRERYAEGRENQAVQGMTPDLPAGDLLADLRRELDRNVYRARNGIKYVTGGEWAEIDPTPSDIIFQEGKVKLRRYHRDSPARFGPPVLAFIGLVSRAYILDLWQGNSLVQRLMDAGFEAFVLDWGEPDETDAHNTLETYIEGYMSKAIKALIRETGSDEINVIGYCMGGNLALVALASQPDGPWRNLVTMATPIDFREGGPLIEALRDGRIDVESLIDDTGNIPGSVVEHFFRIRHPTARAVLYANLWQNLWNDEYMKGFQAMGRWVNEQIPIAGAAARQLIDNWVRENAFYNDALRLGGRRISLGDIQTPTFSVIADRDEIVPQAMAGPVVERLSGTSPDVLHVDAGHTSLTTGRMAAKVTVPKVTEWLAAHSEELR